MEFLPQGAKDIDEAKSAPIENVENPQGEEPEIPPIRPAEPENKPQEPEIPPVESEATPDDFVESETETVSSFQELSQWLNSHMRVGGRVKLANDITLEKEEHYLYADWLNSQPTYIETGGYTIYVEGYLEIYTTKAHFSGKGGAQGIFHLTESGNLTVKSSIEATDGYAIYQEEGSILDVDSSGIQGKIHYARKPVAWSVYDMAEYFGIMADIPTLVYPLKGDFDISMLPDSSPAVIYEEGRTDYKEKEIKTLWHEDGIQEKFEEKERFILTGDFPEDVVARGTPAYLVTFLREDSAVFQQCAAQRKPDKLILELYVMLDDPSLEYHLEISTDNENWQEDQEGQWEEISDNVVMYLGAFPDTSEIPRYFSVGVVGKDGITRYSDTIELTGDDKLGSWDDGGGRNGETLPDGGVTLPGSGVGSGGSGSSGGGKRPADSEPESETESIVMPPISWERLELAVKLEIERAVEAFGQMPLPDVLQPISLDAENTEPKGLKNPKQLPSKADPSSLEKAQVKGQGEPQTTKKETEQHKEKVTPTEKENTKSKQKALAVAMIFLLGAPIYLMPLWKPLFRKHIASRQSTRDK